MKKHRKIQKKQETELYVQVAEKSENQKENVGEALACFCIYVGWYLMVMQFCRASLAMTLSGSVGAILLVMAVLVNGQKEKKFIRKIVHEILAAAVLCFLISFTIRKGWIFQGALILLHVSCCWLTMWRNRDSCDNQGIILPIPVCFAKFVLSKPSR